MSDNFTLIYLVNQIKAEFLESSPDGLNDNDSELSDSSCFADHSPSSRSVRAILDYSRQLEVAETKSVGKVEWILN
jgi:hypothetical protein